MKPSEDKRLLAFLEPQVKHGPQSTYTAKKAAIIVNAVREGQTRKAASALAAVPWRTMMDWERQFINFATQLQIATEYAEAEYVAVVAKAAKGWKQQKKIQTIKRHIEPDGSETRDEEHQIIESDEMDWRAAQYWLRARRNTVWGDRKLPEEGTTVIQNNNFAVLVEAIAKGAPIAEQEAIDISPADDFEDRR